MSDPTLIQALPQEVRGAYQKSCERMTPTGMALDFGLVDITDDGETDEPDEFNPHTDIGREAKQLAVHALRYWEGIHATHWSSMADATVDKRAAFLRSAQHAQTILSQVNAAHDGLLARIEEKAAHLALVLGNACKPPTSVGDAQIDAEVRGMIRAEPSPEKAMALAKAHPRAIATLPEGIGAVLVGPAGYRTVRHAHLQVVAPEALAENKEVKRALSVIARAQTELTQRTRTMIDFNAADQMAKHANWKPYAAAA